MNNRWRGLLASYFGRFTPDENPLPSEWAGYAPEPARVLYRRENRVLKTIFARSPYCRVRFAFHTAASV